MLLVIDNFDSFTYNLVQYFGELGVEQKVLRNNQIDGEGALKLKPDKVLVSPGPCSPNEAGNSIDIIDKVIQAGIPLFGVCLGHQCIAQYYGARIIRAERLMHGKTSPIHHEGTDVFNHLPNPFPATRYHSLLVDHDTFPDCLHISAKTETGEIMGLVHKHKPVYGVQFHPESLATQNGMQILKNFMANDLMANSG